jgi:hypothetical protein
MKKKLTNPLLLVAIVGLTLLFGCKKDNGGEPVTEFAAPTITITSPSIPTDGLITEVGATTTFSINVTAEAGLSTVKMDDKNIKTYSGTETVDTLKHDFLPLEAEKTTLIFEVEDALGKTSSVNVTVIVEEGVDLGYLLLDFAGSLTATTDKTVVDWDIRKVFTFNVNGSHVRSATAEVVNVQAQMSFEQSNPSTEDNAKVVKIEKIITDDTRDNWGGWAHIIFNLGSMIPTDTISKLPTWDNDGSATVPGTKVVQVDAYYDATIDAGFTWDTLVALKDIWNADPGKGYKIDLALATYDPMGIAESGHDGAFYMGYYAYISEPNKWVTLTFEMIDEGRTGSMYGQAAEAPGPDAINCIKIIPSPGYVSVDSNPLYLKNLRIVDVE